MAKKKINLQGKEVRLISEADSEYICITDIAKAGEGNHHDIVKNYFKNRSNIEFLGLGKSSITQILIGAILT